MSVKPKAVSMTYFGQKIGNGQDPDEPYDAAAKKSNYGMKLSGMGSQGGGSKPTPQAKRLGTAKNHGSHPRQSQKIRG